MSDGVCGVKVGGAPSALLRSCYFPDSATFNTVLDGNEDQLSVQINSLSIIGGALIFSMPTE